MSKLYEQLIKYGDSDMYPYHMPGHKRQAWGQLPKEIARMDITEIDGFDNLHQPEGILRKLQERAAALYGAEESFYMINGSSGGILAAISAALPFGGHLLMARNCHKAAYHAAYLRNLTISYLYPSLLEEYDIYEAVSPEQVKTALELEPDIGAVLLVSPTYEGRIADVKVIAEIVHRKGIPLIVDEAHGAHLGLMPEQKRNSCQLGADLVIHSVHKTLPAMTQTALLHVNGKLVDRDKLKRFLHIYQSTSPSYVLMASIDNALQVMEERGEELFQLQRKYFVKMLEDLKKCRYFSFLPLDEKQDIGKFVISSQKSGLSGQQICDMLLQEYHLQLEMAAGNYCLAMFTMGDGLEAYERMTQALLSMDAFIAERQQHEQHLGKAETGREQFGKEAEYQKLISEACAPIVSIPLAGAWDMAYEFVPLQEAEGRIAGDFINLYPPGVPLLVPGEVLQHAQVQLIQQYLMQGLNVQGVGAEAMHPVKVLKD